jgi:hypothetical protein
MNNTIRQAFIILVLIATIAYAVFTYWPFISPLLAGYLPSPKKPAAAAPQVTVPQPSAASTEAQAKQESALEMSLPTAEANLVDPFSLRIAVKTKSEEPVTTTLQPGTEKPRPKPAEPVLQGIWLDSGMKVAFISDNSVPLGGTIMGWKLIAINDDSITMKKGSVIRVFKIGGKIE